MNVEYNPQLGYRRTIFEGNFDFLLRIADCRTENGLTFTVDRQESGRENLLSPQRRVSVSDVSVREIRKRRQSGF